MRASTFGCIIDSPCASAISRSANASSRCSGGTKASRFTSKSRSSTSGSSTSQVRICCSIMLKRACSKFIADRTKKGSRIVSISIERALVALEGERRDDEQDHGERPHVRRDLGELRALEEDAAHDA